jgi:O-antigen/teichoic acid export membrane protein
MKLKGSSKFIGDLSANTFQTIFVQVFGLLIFYVTSRYLGKEDFGELNWSVAFCSSVISILSFGLDLVFVKKVARNENRFETCGLHFFHTLLVGFLVVVIGLVLKFLAPGFSQNHSILLFVFIWLGSSNIANSFKLGLNGFEAYKQIAILSALINVLKFAGVLLLFYLQVLNLNFIVLTYFILALIELVIAYFMINAQLNRTLTAHFKPKAYKNFILESLPQLAVVLFDSALARIDWILLGLIGTSIATAEYSFTYRVFELSKLPILILSPILLTRFSRLFADEMSIQDQLKDDIMGYFKLEMFFVMLIPIVLINVWSPLIDYFTDKKYGAVNEQTYILLAICIPLHAIINFLWTVAFAKGFLKSIMWITITVSILNIICNILLIPKYSSIGAAIAFLITTIVQLVLYIVFVKQSTFNIRLSDSILAIANAIVAVLIVKLLGINVVLGLIISLCTFTLLSIFTKQIELNKIKLLLRRK